MIKYRRNYRKSKYYPFTLQHQYAYFLNVLYIFPKSVDKENLFDNRALFNFAITSVSLITLTFDSKVIL